VENGRRGGGKNSRVRQRVLHYFGREVVIDDAVIAAVAQRFPDARVDWDALRRAARRPPLKDEEDEWAAWD